MSPAGVCVFFFGPLSLNDRVRRWGPSTTYKTAFTEGHGEGGHPGGRNLPEGALSGVPLFCPRIRCISWFLRSSPDECAGSSSAVELSMSVFPVSSSSAASAYFSEGVIQLRPPSEECRGHPEEGYHLQGASSTAGYRRFLDVSWTEPEEDPCACVCVCVCVRVRVCACAHVRQRAARRPGLIRAAIAPRRPPGRTPRNPARPFFFFSRAASAERDRNRRRENRRPARNASERAPENAEGTAWVARPFFFAQRFHPGARARARLFSASALADLLRLPREIAPRHTARACCPPSLTRSFPPTSFPLSLGGSLPPPLT